MSKRLYKNSDGEWEEITADNTQTISIATTGTTTATLESNTISNGTRICADIMIHAVGSANMEKYYKGVLTIGRYNGANADAVLTEVASEGMSISASVTDNVVTFTISSDTIYNSVIIVLHYYHKFGTLTLS